MKLLSITLALAICATAANWTDRKEYDLVLSVRAATSPQNRLGLLDQWKNKYPKSEFQQVRRELYLSTYQALGDSSKALGVAGEILAAQPDSMVGAYWFTLLLPEEGTASANQLALGEKAGRQLLASQKPQTGVELMTHRTLGWIHWQRREYGPAEEEFGKCLQLDATDAEVSGWLGTVMALEQQPGKQAPALWHLARAAVYQNTTSLSDGQRREFGAVLERLYASYHGDASGLDQLRTAAAAAPLPPAGFDIESAATVALRKQDEELSRTNPQLAEWIRIRQKLEAAGGDKYFSETLHNNPAPKLKGVLIKAEPAGKPNMLTIGVIDPARPEILVKVSSNYANEADPGTVLEFEGTYDSFVQSPFAMTVVSEPSKISGWPSKAPARKGR